MEGNPYQYYGKQNLWKASFTIKNQAGIEITYPVYHTGIFHKIDETSKVYNDYQLTENGDNEKKVKGWFYYGVVKVEGKKAGWNHHYLLYVRPQPRCIQQWLLCPRCGGTGKEQSHWWLFLYL